MASIGAVAILLPLPQISCGEGEKGRREGKYETLKLVGVAFSDGPMYKVCVRFLHFCGVFILFLIRTQASSVFSEVSAAPPTNSGGLKVFVPAVVPSRLIADIQPENLELTRSPPSSRSPQFFWSSLIFLFLLLVSPLTEFSEPPLLGLSIRSLNV